ncbi:MAG: pyrimidine 5'-nucleotidase [Rhodobacteraceae bacterium]|nr:pyrimidine 5'-nucleotidase [Paracoccaceae bacterium]
MKNAFSHVTHWVFDLDNTLYPPEAALFDQIEVKMTEYVMRELKVDEKRATYLREHYWQTYGTTLSGMMREHDVDPLPYLTEVHEIDLDHLTQDLALRGHIRNLPGRKIVYTNGSQFHADRVLEARGLAGLFDAVYGIEHSGFHPKPSRPAYQAIVDADQIDTTRAAMFEDDPRNLEIPHDMGMKTVLVGAPAPRAYIQHQTEDLTAFLSQIVG